jgi:hypothetical protein
MSHCPFVRTRKNRGFATTRRHSIKKLRGQGLEELKPNTVGGVTLVASGNTFFSESKKCEAGL